MLLLAYLYYCTQIAIEIFSERFDFYDALLVVPNGILALVAFVFVGVVVRVVAQLVRRTPWTKILRIMLGEPTWWRTWYPRTLRDPGSVWDRLPTSLKLLRTFVWLELLLLPAGVVLVVFVTPTFEVVFASLGLASPLIMDLLGSAVTIGGYLLPVILLAAVVQGRRWQTDLGLPRLVAFNALFSVNRHFWRDTDARRLLLDHEHA
jgi:hypothetical protein